VTLDSLDDRETPQELKIANYSGVITNNFLVEAGYSERKYTFGVHGSKFPDFVRGTTMWDAANNVIYNTSLFCGHSECPGAGDYRNNQEYMAKASYFLSTESAGSHDIVFGGGVFSDQRAANNYQSGSASRSSSSSRRSTPARRRTSSTPSATPTSRTTRSSSSPRRPTSSRSRCSSTTVGSSTTTGRSTSASATTRARAPTRAAAT